MNRNENFPNSDEDIAAIYRALSDEQPHRDVDQVILAAARREAARGDSVGSISTTRTRFWDRLRIPVSMAAAAVVTLTFAQLMFPLVDSTGIVSENRSKPPGGSSDLVFKDFQNATSSVDEAALTGREKIITAPEAPVVPAILKELDSASMTDPELVDSIYQTASRGPEALWAAKISKLAKSGQYHQMNVELAKFVEMYPEYPILKVIRPDIN